MSHDAVRDEGELVMKRSVKSEIAIWSVCMSIGITMLLAQLIVAQRSQARDVEPLQRPWTDTVLASSQPAQRPNAKSQPVTVRKKDSQALLVEAIVQVESGGNPGMVGKAGERGLMQVKKDTWNQMSRRAFGRKVSFETAFDPAVNRKVGAAYLTYLKSFLASHKHDWKADERSLLLACYNAGPGRVKEAGFCLTGLPATTRDYVQRASALHQYFLQEEQGVVTLASVISPNRAAL